MASDDKRAGEVLNSLPRSRPTRRSARRPTAAPAGDERGTKRTTATAGDARRAAPQAKPKLRGATRPSNATRRVRVEPPESSRTSAPAGGVASPEALIGTAVQAAGEVARVGVSLTRAVVRQALDRLPR